MLSLICNTKNHSNNRKIHTNSHLQGRLCNLFQILTSDVVTTTRFCAESCQLTNNNKTPGSDIFCKERFFCVGLFISKSQTDSIPCFRHKVLLLSSCRLLVLNPSTPLSESAFPVLECFYAAVLHAVCTLPMAPRSCVIRCHNQLNDRAQSETKDVV